MSGQLPNAADQGIAIFFRHADVAQQHGGATRRRIASASAAEAAVTTDASQSSNNRRTNSRAFVFVVNDQDPHAGKLWP